jgi:hypothetical protein
MRDVFVRQPFPSVSKAQKLYGTDKTTFIITLCKKCHLAIHKEKKPCLD